MYGSSYSASNPAMPVYTGASSMGASSSMNYGSGVGTTASTAGLTSSTYQSVVSVSPYQLFVIFLSFLESNCTAIR